MGSLAKQTRRPRGAKGGKEEGEDDGGRPPPPQHPKIHDCVSASVTLQPRPTSVRRETF